MNETQFRDVLARLVANGPPSRVDIADIRSQGRRRRHRRAASMGAAPLAAAAAVALFVSGAVPLGLTSGPSVRPRPSGRTTAEAGVTAYVASQCRGGVTPISVATGKAGKAIDPNSYFTAMVATPDGKTLYLGNHGTNKVIPVSTATGTLGKPIRAGLKSAGGVSALAMAPDGKVVYALALRGRGRSGTVTPISTATNTPGKPISIGPDYLLSHGSSPLAVTPDGRTVYAVNEALRTVTPISAATGTAGKPIPAGHLAGPHGGISIAVTPDGRTLYIATWSSVIPVPTATNRPGKPIEPPHRAAFTEVIAAGPNGKTVYAGTGRGGVLPISTATNTPGKLINIGEGIDLIGFTPDGGTAYVLSEGSGSGSLPGMVTPISTATNTAGTPFKTGASGPTAIAFTPDGKIAYIANIFGPGSVLPVSTATSTPGKLIKIAGCPGAIVITP